MSRSAAGGPRASRSLAARITFLTLSTITSFAVIAGALALYGVSRMAQQESTARLTAYRQIVVDAIRQRLTATDRVLDSYALSGKVTPKQPEAIRQGIRQLAVTDDELFDVIGVADLKGRVIASVPSRALPPNIAKDPFFKPVRAETGTTVIWGAFDGSGTLTGWLVHAVPNPHGRSMVLVARLKTGFLRELVDAAASSADGRAAMALAPGDRLFVAGLTGPAMDPALMLYSQVATGLGEVRVPRPTGVMSGLYQDVGLGPDSVLRIVVAEPDSMAFARSSGALVPSGLVVLFGVVALAGMAALVSTRVTRPIRQLERRAKDVSSGAYVRPLPVDSDDEIGQMSSAFNTMASRINMLQDVSHLLADASETDEVLDGIISATTHLLKTDGVAVFLAEDTGSDLVLSKTSGLRRRVDEVSVPRSAQCVVTEAARSSEPVTFTVDPESARSDRALDVFDVSSARSGAAIPLVFGARLLGVVIVMSPGRRAFTAADIETLRAFCAQAAVAVHNSRLFSDERMSRREAEALKDVAELLASSPDAAVALDRVAVVATSLLAVGTVDFALADRKQLGLEPSADDDRERARLRMAKALSVGTGEDASGRAPVVVRDAAGEPSTADYARSYGVLRALLVPVFAGGDLAGAMACECATSGAGFTPRQVQLAAALGNEVSLALNGRLMLTRERARAASLERIFRISQTVSSSLQVKTVLTRVLDVVQRLFGAHAVSLMRFDTDTRTLTTDMARGIHDKDLLFFRCDPSDDVPGAVYQSKAPLLLGSFDGARTRLIELAVGHGFRSLLSVPLVARGRAIGVLTVFSKDEGGFSEGDMDVLATFASQAALATDTAELYGREHTVATVLKASILPDALPEIAGLSACAAYRPATAQGGPSEIGGDYYDLFETGNGKIVLAIADVCGQGVRAATRTSMIRYALRGMAAVGATPGRMMSELNRMVVETGETSDIVTAFVGVLDRDSLVLRYANAGHPPPLVCARGTASPLEPTGPLLGAVPDMRYGEEERALAEGDLVVLYTDGVTEARSNGDMYGEARLRALLSPAGTPREVTQRIVAAVIAHAGDLRDDLAILAVSVASVTDESA